MSACLLWVALAVLLFVWASLRKASFWEGSWWRLVLVVLALLCLATAAEARPVNPSRAQEVPYVSLFRDAAGPRWIDRAAQAWAESGFDARAVSYVKGRDGIVRPCAYGLSQWTLPSWATAQDRGWAPRGSSPLDPAACVPAQHLYMIWLEGRCGGRLDPALGAYNAGLGSVRKAQALASALGLPGEAAWLQALPRVTGEANAAQTRGYLAHNRTFRQRLAALEARP